MPPAAGAGDFDAPHAEGIVFVLGDGFGISRDDEAGPATAGVKFGPGEKEQLAAACAVVVAGFMILGQSAGVGALGTLFAKDVILLRSQFLGAIRRQRG